GDQSRPAPELFIHCSHRRHGFFGPQNRMAYTEPAARDILTGGHLEGTTLLGLRQVNDPHQLNRWRSPVRKAKHAHRSVTRTTTGHEVTTARNATDVAV